mmetsp:Transcript_27792/g.73401  ORF Transcript_27792/g.73401 Transcript_27792/m.73401 type:complete len:226 (-) Transcript_27792:317-994(-)
MKEKIIVQNSVQNTAINMIRNNVTTTATIVCLIVDTSAIQMWRDLVAGDILQGPSMNHHFSDCVRVVQCFRHQLSVKRFVDIRHRVESDTIHFVFLDHHLGPLYQVLRNERVLLCQVSKLSKTRAWPTHLSLRLIQRNGIGVTMFIRLWHAVKVLGEIERVEHVESCVGVAHVVVCHIDHHPNILLVRLHNQMFELISATEVGAHHRVILRPVSMVTTSSVFHDR